MPPETSAPENLECALKTAPEDEKLVQNERRTRWVVWLTLVMMIGELIVGYATNSLALTADGWHMGTHVAALGMSLGAYWFARTRAKASHFSFGTGKVHALSGYTSSILLALVAIWMMYESARRLLEPEHVAFAQALPVAVLGLVVNLVSMKMLHTGPDAAGHGGHAHGHGGHAHTSPHQDHNLRAAYIHVLTDALTSLTAILALLGGQYFGWDFLDATMGIVGGVVILRWSLGLCRGAARQLLDVVPELSQLAPIQSSFEAEFPEAQVVDLHIWELGPNQRACIISVLASAVVPVSVYRDFLSAKHSLGHVTVEVHLTADASQTARPDS